MVFSTMVLEGLKRAECFVGLLRRLGYQREDGKPSKPEHFDQEFANRQYGAVLGDLLASLQARILTDEEIAQLEHLARLGLLDGLIEEEQPATVSKSSAEAQQDESEVEQLAELVQDYEGELSALDGRMRLLLGELDQDVDLTIDCPPICPPLGSDFDGSTAVLEDELLKTNRALNEHLSQLMMEKLATLLRPIDTNSIEDPAYRFRSVCNEDLVEHSWHPDDYALYSTKIDSAIEILKREFNVELDRSEVLQDEFTLANLRTTHQQTVLQALCRFESERMALNRLMIAICQRHVRGWDPILQDTTLAQLQGLVDAIEDHLQNSHASKLYWQSPSVPTKIELVDLNHRHEQLVAGLSVAKQIVSRLVNDQGEVNLIPASAASVEAQARAVSMEVSALLQSTLTEAKRLDLFIRGEN